MLPPTYRAFLGRHRGGRPRRPVFPIRGMPLNPEGEARCLYRLGGPSYQDVEAANSILRCRIGSPLPPRLLAIGDTDCGDQLVLVVRGRNKGQVYFWDVYKRTDRWPRKLYFVAPSFEAFLASLRPRGRLDLEPPA